ncbi:MAG TPA: pseudoazurin [Sinorhizobium sp.]|nr:pseudoazurin [Sinorhizobium sp.]
MVFMAGGAAAGEHEVKMLNKGESGAMVFEPTFIKAAPGDTIRFVPVDKGHNVESIKGMMPDGVERFKSKVNEEHVMTVTSPGLYGVKCSPHFSMGMVALIQVGEVPANFEAVNAVKLPKKADERLQAALAGVSR